MFLRKNYPRLALYVVSATLVWLSILAYICYLPYPRQTKVRNMITFNLFGRAFLPLFLLSSDSCCIDCFVFNFSHAWCRYWGEYGASWPVQYCWRLARVCCIAGVSKLLTINNILLLLFFSQYHYFSDGSIVFSNPSNAGYVRSHMLLCACGNIRAEFS